MTLEQFAALTTRIREATRFDELVVIDAELRALPQSARTAWLLEEVELRAGPTVYGALLRLEGSPGAVVSDPSEIPGVTPGEGFTPKADAEEPEADEEPEAIDIMALDPDDEPAVEAAVAKIVEAQLPPVWDESTHSTTPELMARPGFPEAIATIEREEAGQWPADIPAPVASVLTKIANSGSQGEIFMVLQQEAAPLGDTVPEDEHVRIRRYATERMLILRGTGSNADGIQTRRRARAMGMSPADLVELRRLDMKEQLPYRVRSTIEVMREERPKLQARIEALMESQDPEQAIELARFKGQISEQIAKRIKDKKEIDRLLGGLPDSPDTGRGHGR